MWTSGKAKIVRKHGRTRAIVSHMRYMNGQAPPGVSINPDLARPDSALRAILRMVMTQEEGEVEVGTVRWLNGGAILQIAGSHPLEFGSSRCSHDRVGTRIMARVANYLGGEPVKMVVVACRDAAAPFTHWVFDAGGVGRGDTPLACVEEYLVDRCLNEMVTETGLLVDTSVASGWVGYTYQGNTHQKLHDAVTKQWRAAHRHAPGASPISVLDLSLSSLPDTLEITDWGTELNDVSISFEEDNASLEVIVAAEGRFTSFPDDGRLRFLDLEVSDSGPLRRRIGVICIGPAGKRMALTYHQDGDFDATMPPLPLTDEILPWVANEKLVTVLKYL